MAKAEVTRCALCQVVQQWASCQNDTISVFKVFWHFSVHVHIEIHISYNINEIHLRVLLSLSVGPIYILDVWLWVITMVGTLRILIQKLCKRLLDRLLSESWPILSNIRSESILHSSGTDSRQKVFDLKSWLLSPKASFVSAHALHPAQYCHSFSTVNTGCDSHTTGHTAHS